MSRFVTEGSLSKEQLDAIEEKENEEAQKYKDEEAEKERKTLYEQLKANRARLEQEREKVYRKKYLAHHVNDDAKTFYEGLKNEEIQREQKLKNELDKGMEEFYEFQKDKTVRKQKVPVSVAKDGKNIKIVKQSTKIKKKKAKVII